ncbi:MAG: hypothetical protein Q9214_004880 [Letrouitia sp. 1 TL-2023]
MAGVMLEATTNDASASPLARKRKKSYSSPKSRAPKGPRAPKVKAPKAPKRATAPKPPVKDGQQHQQANLSQQNSFKWNAAAVAATLQGFMTAAPVGAAGNPFSTQVPQPMPIPSNLEIASPFQSFHNAGPPMPLRQVAMQPTQPFEMKTLPKPPQQISTQPRQSYGCVDSLTSEESTEEEATNPRPIPVEYSDKPPIKDGNSWKTEYGTLEWLECWIKENPKRPKEYIEACEEEWVEVPRIMEEENGRTIWTPLKQKGTARAREMSWS